MVPSLRRRVSITIQRSPQRSQSFPSVTNLAMAQINLVLAAIPSASMGNRGFGLGASERSLSGLEAGARRRIDGRAGESAKAREIPIQGGHGDAHAARDGHAAHALAEKELVGGRRVRIEFDELGAVAVDPGGEVSAVAALVGQAQAETSEPGIARSLHVVVPETRETRSGAL